MDELIEEFQHVCSLRTNEAGNQQDIEATLKRTIVDLDALKVSSLFDKVQEEDIIFFNMDSSLCRPSDLVLKFLPVPPSCIRPTVAVSHGMKNEDDLTMKVAEIVERDKLIQQAIENGLEPHKLMDEWYLLSCSVAQYLNSETPGLPIQMSTGKSIRALNQRLKGKHGRFRQNLSGKRVDFTGRTVISPDPNCAID